MTPGDTSARPARRGRRILLRAVGILALSALLVELTLRLILFTDVPGLQRVTLQLRQPANFYRKDDPGFWTTSVRFTPKDHLKPIPRFDRLVGWAGSRVKPETYEHVNEDLILDRRPVLLYGDSFAECVTPTLECWQGLLQHSELGRTHLLLNYGVGGYGLDQAILMLRASLPRFREKNPVVILSVYVEDDLNRMLLPFRGWPKPQFHVVDGKLVQPDPVPEGVDAYLEQHSPFVWSWAWLYLRRALSDPAEEAAQDRATIEEMTRLLLSSLKVDLDREGVDWFMLLFQGESILGERSRGSVWQHDFLTRTLHELDIPYVSVRREIAKFVGTPGSNPSDLFIQTGQVRGHYSALGNEAVFPAFLRGLRGEFE